MSTGLNDQSKHKDLKLARRRNDKVLSLLLFLFLSVQNISFRRTVLSWRQRFCTNSSYLCQALQKRGNCLPVSRTKTIDQSTREKCCSPFVNQVYHIRHWSYSPSSLLMNSKNETTAVFSLTFKSLLSGFGCIQITRICTYEIWLRIKETND